MVEAETETTTEKELVIAFESDVPSILSKLEESRYNSHISVLRFHEIELDGQAFASTIHLLKSGRKWDHVEFVDCENQTCLAMAISIAMIIANVKSLKYGAFCIQHNIILALSAALQANAPTQSLQLDTCITLRAANSIGKGLSDNTQILTLDLSGCEFSYNPNNNNTSPDEEITSLQALCKGLAKNSTIRTLKFSGCGLNDNLIAVLIRQGLIDHPALTELWLDGNYCRNVGLVAISEMLQKETTKLSILSLNSQGFENGDEEFDLASIATALEKNVSLTSLDLSNNCTILGTARLLDPSLVATILKTNKSLMSLDLSNNCLDDHDLKQLIDCLDVNLTLEAIQLGSNNITEEGLSNFLDNIEEMKGLKRVGFSGNLFEETAIRMLYELFPNSISTDY